MKTIILSCILFGYVLAQETFEPEVLLQGGAAVVIAPPAQQPTVTIACGENDACKDFLNIYVSSDVITTDCGGINSCIKSFQRYGNIAPPAGTARTQNPPPYESLFIDCNGEKSCANSLITIVGTYTKGIRIEATGIASLADSTLTFDVSVPEGVSCKLVCGGTGVNSCLGLTIIDVNKNCKCIGASCPVFPAGSDPDGEATLGYSPNFPDLKCIAGTDDNPPDECRLPGPVGFPNGHVDGTLENIIKRSSFGEITCTENYDCCLCYQLICEDCKAVNCGGDEGCIATQIIVDGSPLSGGSVGCNGDGSCMHSQISGDNVVGVLADGDISCKNCTINLNPNGNPYNLPGVRINCNGDGSCEESEITALNVDALICTGDNSCLLSEITLDCPGVAGCPFTCAGDESCRQTTVLISSGARSINCGGDESCDQSTFDITCYDSGCSFSCGGDNACQDTDAQFGPATTVSCAGDESCKDSNFIATCIDGLGCPVTCGGEQSCERSNFDIDNVQLVSCSGESVCRNATMNLDCVNGNGCPVTCLGPSSCYNAEFTLTNADDVMCGGTMACGRSLFNFQDTKGGSLRCSGFQSCFQGQFLGITEMAMVSCTQASACETAVITGESITGVSLSCTGLTDTCSGLQFINLNSLEGTLPKNIAGGVSGILCKGTNACKDANILTRCDNCKFDCDGIQSCFNLNNGGIYGVFEMSCTNTAACGGGMNTIGIRDNFILVCGAGACSETSFRFVVDPDGTLGAIDTDITAFGIINAPTNEVAVTTIKGPECNGLNSCSDTTFTFVNQQLTAIDVLLIKCGDVSSCTGASFIFEGLWNVDANTFSCPNVDCSNIASVIVDGVDITATLPSRTSFAGNKGIADIGGGYWFIIVSGGVMLIVLSVFAAKYFKNKKLKQVAMEKEMDENQKKKKNIDDVKQQVDIDDTRSTTI